MTGKMQRDIQRSVHLVASAILIAYFYTPLGDNDIFSTMVRAMVIPMLLVTGVLMWQMPRIRRMHRSWRARMSGAKGLP
jgi:hypothetical protein